MNKRRIGTSDLYVSEIGLGCMSLGTDENHAIYLIHEALERGINYLDTADLYDRGLNEEFVGKAVKGKRDQVIIATKVGNRWRRPRRKRLGLGSVKSLYQTSGQREPAPPANGLH